MAKFSAIAGGAHRALVDQPGEQQVRRRLHVLVDRAGPLVDDAADPADQHPDLALEAAQLVVTRRSHATSTLVGNSRRGREWSAGGPP